MIPSYVRWWNYFRPLSRTALVPPVIFSFACLYQMFRSKNCSCSVPLECILLLKIKIKKLGGLYCVFVPVLFTDAVVVSSVPLILICPLIIPSGWSVV